MIFIRVIFVTAFILQRTKRTLVEPTEPIYEVEITG